MIHLKTRSNRFKIPVKDWNRVVGFLNNLVGDDGIEVYSNDNPNDNSPVRIGINREAFGDTISQMINDGFIPLAGGDGGGLNSKEDEDDTSLDPDGNPKQTIMVIDNITTHGGITTLSIGFLEIKNGIVVGYTQGGTHQMYAP